MIPKGWTVKYPVDFAQISTGNKDTQDKVNNGKYPFYVRSAKIERINSYSYEGTSILTVGDGVGTGKVFHYAEGKFDFHQRVYKISDFKEYVNPKYFYYYFSRNFIRQVVKYTAKTSVDSVRMEMISKMKIPLPPLPEQKKIVEILSTWDQAIEKIERLVSAKEKQFKWFFNKLLSQEGWPMVKLGEVCETMRGGSPRPIQNYLTKDENGINWIKIGDVAEGEKYITKTKQKIKEEGITKTRLVKYGDFVFSNSMSFGRPYILKIDGAIHDGWLLMRIKNRKKVLAGFLYQILGANMIKEKYQKLAAGGVVKNLNSDLVQSVQIPLPRIAIQKKIVAQLSIFEESIRLLKNVKQKYEEQKRALMQQLLTGKKRVRV